MQLSLLILSIVAAGTLGIRDLNASPGTSTQAVAVAASHGSTGERLASAAKEDTVTLHIEGMTCGGCTLATRKVLERLDGVTKADVSYEKKRAVVTYDPARVTVTQMIAAVATLKYVATVEKS